MKNILSMQELFGTHIRTRVSMERLRTMLQPENEYLLDFAGVEFISRSAADELYNILHQTKDVAIIHTEPFVQKMIDAVTIGRFLPRQRPATSMSIIECPTIESLVEQLKAR
jgi:hypothetical protein